MISGRTRLAAVIGSPVDHSLSPAIHNAAFAALDLDWAYVAFEVAAGQAGSAVEAMRVLDLGGLSVTMPHKSDVIHALDRLDPAAQRLGAVNCVAWEGDALVGHNTDGAGFVDGLADDLAVAPAGLAFAVIGAGGAARAVVAALADAGAARVVVVNRDSTRAAAAASLGGSVGEVGVAEQIRTVDVVVNATPVGMGDGMAPFDLDLLVGQAVVDLIYEPQESPLLRAARAQGLQAANGVSMLVHQAAHAFGLWTGRDAPVAAIRREIRARNS